MKLSVNVRRYFIVGIVAVFLNNLSFVVVAKDSVEPLKLRKIMFDMGENMQVITDGISRENWKRVEKNATLIADHPQPPMTEKSRIVKFMGTRMADFKRYDGQTHQSARQLSEVAKRGNGVEIITAFYKLQNTCLACHITFRKSLVEHFYQSPKSQ